MTSFETTFLNPPYAEKLSLQSSTCCSSIYSFKKPNVILKRLQVIKDSTKFGHLQGQEQLGILSEKRLPLERPNIFLKPMQMHPGLSHVI